MTAVKYIYNSPTYQVFDGAIPKVQTKKKSKSKAESFELGLICVLLIFGNIVALIKSTSLTLGFFGYFLLGITAISLLGTVLGNAFTKSSKNKLRSNES